MPPEENCGSCRRLIDAMDGTGCVPCCLLGVCGGSGPILQLQAMRTRRPAGVRVPQRSVKLSPRRKRKSAPGEEAGQRALVSSAGTALWSVGGVVELDGRNCLGTAIPRSCVIGYLAAGFPNCSYSTSTIRIHRAPYFYHSWIGIPCVPAGTVSP